MTRRDFWIGVVLIVGALVFHAAVPRYEWHTVAGMPWRADRWRGTITPPAGAAWPR